MEQGPKTNSVSNREKEEFFDVEKSPLKEAYKLLNAKTPLELSRLYTEQDQILFKSGEWDYKNPEQITNKIKTLLEEKGEAGLTEDEKEWRQEILWFWYHHAISVAMWPWYHDKAKAQEFAEKALALQDENHPNKITRLLHLLVNDNLEEAEEWAETIEGKDKETALDTIKDFKEKPPF